MPGSNLLPSFQDPPVVEVLASVQFDPLPDFNVLSIGQLWEKYRGRFPKIEQHIPLGAEIERLGSRAPLNTLQFQFAQDHVVPRVWFLDKAGAELIQVQGDRFIRNWRHISSAKNVYPRYEAHVRPQFLSDFQTYLDFVRENKLGALSINQCEITYINHIYPNSHWSRHADIGAVLDGWAASAIQPFGLALDAINSRFAYLMEDDKSQFIGRLHVTLQTAFVPSSGNTNQELPVFVLTLTARGRPLGDGDEAVVGFLDRGRTAIVNAFDKMTTRQMHQIWGKQQ